MTLVRLSTVWLNADPDGDQSWSDAMRFAAAAQLERTASLNIDFQETASGRTRAVHLPGGTSQWTITATLASADEIEWLRRHHGEVVCARDHRGQKMFGIYRELPESVVRGTPWSTITLTLRAVTISEAV